MHLCAFTLLTTLLSSCCAMDTRGKRGSLDDICIHISRFRHDRFSALSLTTLPPCERFSDTTLLPSLLALPKLDSQVQPSCLPFFEPGSGWSVDSDVPFKPAIWADRPHVPRPPNAFILFRCDFVQKRKLNPQESAISNVSRIAAEAWNRMTPEQKQPWISLAAKEKERHATLYPDYKYTPANYRVKRTPVERCKSPATLATGRHRDVVHSPALGSGEQRSHNDRSAMTSRRDPAIRWHPYHQQTPPQRRSSSCPPIGVPLATYSSELQTWAPALVSIDDLRCNLVRPDLLQPTGPQNVFQPVTPGLDLPHSYPSNLWFGVPEPYPLATALHQSEACGPLQIPSTDSTSPLDPLGCMEFLTLCPTLNDPFKIAPTSSEVSKEYHTFPPYVDTNATGLNSLLRRPDNTP